MIDLNTFVGTDKPSWNPNCLNYEFHPQSHVRRGSYVVFDNILSEESCNDLIEQFDAQEVYPVGIDGYSTGDRIGSYRAMAWAEELARKMNPLWGKLPDNLWGRDGKIISPHFVIPSPFAKDRKYHRLGSTPWMRFMRYKEGGMHVPHYDAPFEQPEYITLFSWVMYLNDVPDEHGGSFDFVDDYWEPEAAEKRTDWTRMANPSEIMTSIQPKRGRLLVFPHWLCHQVNAYTGPDHRYIIRGDLAYGIE